MKRDQKISFSIKYEASKWILIISCAIDVEQALLRPGEEILHLVVGDVVHALVLPLRVLVFLDQKSSNALIELSVSHVALSHTVLHLEHIFKLHVSSSFDLFKDDSQGERTHIGHHFSCLGTEFSITGNQSVHAVLNGVRLENLANLFDVIDWI